MTKDIIYIDIEDDITAIIGKVKASREKIIALVPPKRIGALQSVVNLRLLKKKAEEIDKKIVLITNNQSLIALATNVKIPVAKNLQSKPEIAEIPALEIDEGDDVIDGAQLPVGELARTADSGPEQKSVEDAVETIDVEAEELTPLKSVNRFDTDDSYKSSKKSKPKVPDFSRFRKKLILGVVFGGLLTALLVWAMTIAPSAKIIITAKTTKAPVSLAVTLNGTNPTDITKGTIQTITKTLKKDISVDFTATGNKKLGDKSTGTMTLSNADSSDAIYIPAGSILSSGNYDFVTNSAVNVPGARIVSGHIVAGSVNVAVTAANIGADYNLPAGAYDSSISGITALGSAMSGGSSHDAIVVTADDIQKATEALKNVSTSDVKKQLTAEFVNGETVIGDSFIASYDTPVALPAVDSESVDGKAKLTSSVTFTIIGMAKSEIETYLKNAITKQITDSKSQRIYDDGVSKLILSGYQSSDTAKTINIATVGQIGPNIDMDAIKSQVKGLNYGSVQSLIEQIDGVDNVDIKFSYFWVTTVPNDTKKIEVQFILNND
ncbi:hypothetical protein HGB24_01730 [Candidatus Saccharibacteria bacterium]|nr:hypothetical protein [Candidatus Saccharibacteria bacterium]